MNLSFLTSIMEYIKNIRPRTHYTITGTLVVFILMFISDPDTHILENIPFGAEQLVLLTIIAKSLLYATLLHVTRKAFLDYPEADYRSLLSKAIESPTGAGAAAIALSIMTFAFALVIALAALA